MGLFAAIAGFFKSGKTFSVAEVLAQEKNHVDEVFARHFDPVFSRYLEDDYPNYLNREYPELLAQKGYTAYMKAEDYPEKQRPGYGFSISGGGIRSASFAIGVMQALSHPGFYGSGKPTIFNKFKYLSTVSGGGYAGSALTWYQGLFGFFPFGKIASFAGKQNSVDYENATLGYIRTHSEYLVPHSLGFRSLIASVLMSVLHSTFVYTLIFAVLFGLGMTVLSLQPLAGFLQERALYDWVAVNGAINYLDGSVEQMLPQEILFSITFLYLAGIVTAASCVLMLLYALSSFLRRGFSAAHKFRVGVQQTEGRMLVALGGCLALGLLPIVSNQLYGRVIDLESDLSSMRILSGSGLMAVFLAVKQVLSADNIGTRTVAGTVVFRLLSALTVPVFIVFLLAFSFLTTSLLLFDGGGSISLLAFSAITLLLGLMVNINQISPHKMYRDRLMEAFLKGPDVTETAPIADLGQRANITYLTQLAHMPHWTPYQLINCNVILNNATTPLYRGRKGDSFLLSSLFCGSCATSYAETKDFSNGAMSLPTAMAISGAAANPHSGVSGEGSSTQAATSFLLTFFGLRLGYWCINPSHPLKQLAELFRPNYVFPGLASLLDARHNEDNLYIELSDGGHFDNTGVYELIRRRVPVIVVSDGGADLDETFDSLGNMIERCRVDFGTGIRFNDVDFDLSGLLPLTRPTDPDARVFDSKYGLSARGYAIGDIVYPTIVATWNTPELPGFVGKIVYLKTCMTKDLPADIYAYKSAHADFPNQPTSDQFFNERQFESYRELGYQLTKQLLLDKKAMELLP